MKRGLSLLLASAGIFLYRKVKERRLPPPGFSTHFSGISVQEDAEGLELRAKTDAPGMLAVSVEGTDYQHQWRGHAEKGELIARFPAAPHGDYTFSITRLKGGKTLLSKQDAIRGSFTLKE